MRAPSGLFPAEAGRTGDADHGASRDDAGADGAAAFADGEAQALLHGDRRDQLDLSVTLSPGITISVPFRQLDDPGHVGGAEVELRTVVG
jgi:hypothetical protein